MPLESTVIKNIQDDFKFVGIFQPKEGPYFVINFSHLLWLLEKKKNSEDFLKHYQKS